MTAAEVLQRVMEMMMAQQAAHTQQMREVMEAMGGGGRPGGGPRREEAGRQRRIEGKEYSRVEKFGGGEEEFRVWKEEVQVVTRATDGKVEEMMREVEKKGLEVTGEEMERASVDGSLDGFGRKGRELYEVLSG